MTCEKCGWELRVGDYPFCGNGRDHAPTQVSVIGDDIPGGQTIENLGHEPMTFYSKAAIRAEADRRGLRLRDQWAGPHDKHLTNWAAGIDAYTLESARSLLARGSRSAETSPPGSLETFRGGIREIKKWSEVE
jgi:hypothetical protein